MRAKWWGAGGLAGALAPPALAPGARRAAPPAARPRKAGRQAPEAPAAPSGQEDIGWWPKQAVPRVPEVPAAPLAGEDELGCPHFRECSGCTLSSGLDLEREPSTLLAARRYFEEQHGYQGLQLHVGPADGWRWRARLAVRRGPGGPPVVGLFASGSHDVQSIPNCVVQHPAINAAVAVILEAMEACATQPYDELSGGGDLRYLQLTVVQEPGGDQPGPPLVQTVLVWNSAGEAGDGGSRARLERLAAELWRLGRGAGRQPLLHSVYANFNPRRDNTILGPDWRLLHGEGRGWAALGGAAVCYGPGSFMQVNPGAMDACLRAMQGFVPRGAAILDLHAGVGTIGLSLAATCQPRRVRFVEISPHGAEPFQHSAARLAAAAGAGAAEGGASSGAGVELEYIVASAGADPRRWCQGADLAVVDPPRKGLDAASLAFLAGGAAPPGLRRLLYLSCGFPALQRDAAALVGGGHWRLAHAEAFLFFPGTDHIETLAVFDRCDGGGGGG